MFRLLGFLTEENVLCNRLKLLQTWQPLCYCYYWKKSRLLRNNVPSWNTWHGPYSFPIRKTRQLKSSKKFPGSDPITPPRAARRYKCFWPVPTEIWFAMHCWSPSVPYESGSTVSIAAVLIDQPQQAQRTFWTAKACHGYISKQYQIQCRYETVVQ